MWIRIATLGCCISVIACGPRPVELGFWLEPLSFESPRIGEPISQAEYAVIEKVARAEIAAAFEDFDVTVTANRQARYRVIVVPHLRDNRLLRRSGTYARRIARGRGVRRQRRRELRVCGQRRNGLRSRRCEPRHHRRVDRARRGARRDSRVPASIAAKVRRPRQQGQGKLRGQFAGPDRGILRRPALGYCRSRAPSGGSSPGDRPNMLSSPRLTYEPLPHSIIWIDFTHWYRTITFDAT